MLEEVVAEKPTVVTDSFDGNAMPPEEIKQPEIIVEKKEEPILAEKKVDDVIVEKKDEPIIEEKKIESIVAEKKVEPEPIKYAEIEPSKIKEIYAIIDRKEKLSGLLEGEVTKNNAPEIIKAHWQEKYKGLSPQQMEYKFNKQFSTPKAPVQLVEEADEDFEVRQTEWKEQVTNAEMDLLIEANLLRPELEKINSELKLPEIVQTKQSNTLTPEEQAKVIKDAEQFVQNAIESVNKFEGFNVEYKDKDVDIKSTYALSDEEKTNVLGKMKLLAEENYNANAVFAERWVNSDGTFNFDQIAKDIAIIETHDKTAQKFVSDATTKARINYIKDKRQIDLNSSNGGGELQLEDKEAQKKREDAIWS